MKNDLKHIDEIFKNTFENFEADVDPSVWNNVQQNIGSSTSPSNPSSSSSSSVGSSVAKSVLFKTAASIVATAGVIGSVYVISKYIDNEPKQITEEVITNTSEEIAPIISEEKTNQSEENNIAIENNIKEQLNQEENSNTISNKEEANNISAIDENTEQVETNTVETKNVLSNNSTTTENEVNNTSTSTKTIITENNNSSKNTSNEIVQPKEKDLRVAINANVKKGKAPLFVEFNADADVASYLWDFGDGDVSSEANPIHTFKTPGNYKVSLTVMDKDANSKTVTQFIEVEKNTTSKIEDIQNVFTPNGDGMNDIIKVNGEHIKEFHAVIMDSKGNIIFEWTSIDGFWDGKDNNNNLLPKGTYYIAVTAIGEDGEQHTQKKSIQLY